MWDAVVAFEKETGLRYDPEDRKLAEELYTIVQDIERGDLDRAIQYVTPSSSSCHGTKCANTRWCDLNREFLQSPPHPSSLPFYLHRTIFTNLPAKEAILYARQYLMPFMPSHQVLPLLTSALYHDRQVPTATQQPPEGSLVALFREEFCRRHGWPKEDPLEVIVDLGSRGGALNAVEKARKLIGERLGQDARTWDELPVCLLPPPWPLSLLAALMRITDGDPVACLKEVSFGIRLPSIERTSNRVEPSENAFMRSHNCLRVTQENDQTRVCSSHSLINSE